ncbi:MAG: DUF6531 domain-containing protein [Bacteroidales bacterium]
MKTILPPKLSGKPVCFLFFLFLFAGIIPVNSQNYTKPNIPGDFGTFVNSYTGNLYYPRTDLVIPGQSLNLEIIFSYNSGRSGADYGFGHGWTFNYNQFYEFDGNDLLFDKNDGGKDRYIWNGISYNPPVGVYNELTEYSPGQFVLKTKHGIKFYFENSTHKKLTKIEDRNSNELLLTYTNGQVTLITDPYGRQLLFDYDQNGHLIKITDPNHIPQREITYEYDPVGNMIKVTNPAGNFITYGYGLWRNLTHITDARGNMYTVSYNSNKAVDELSCLAENTKSTIHYNDLNKETSVEDFVTAGNTITTYIYDNNARISQLQTTFGTTSFSYDANNSIISVTDPNGNATTYTYDSKGIRYRLQIR